MADFSRIDSDGGQYSVNVAAGTLANTPVSTTAGRICRVMITTSGSANLLIYDSATTTGAAGSVLVACITGAQAVGSVLNLQLPVTTGILPLQVTNTPGVCLTYSKDTAYGV